MASPLAKKLEKALGCGIKGSRPMHGGDIADVSLLTLQNGARVVAKRPRADQPDTTDTEALMLQHLKAHSSLPVPDILFHAPGILVLSHIPHAGPQDVALASKSVAINVAQLHACVAESVSGFGRSAAKGVTKPYGFKHDTYIGPLVQQNAVSASWVSFFRDRRLLAMAGSCQRTDKLSSSDYARVEKLALKLGDLIPDTPPASLLHGDLWAGNMLIDGDHAAGFIDPAISYGHNEMDLAFIDLMGGLDPVFFDAYNEHRPIEPGFHEERKSIYQLWPLLVHVRLFGGGYVAQVSRILEQFDC
ncbi:fructosamine kinase family protein [Kordiimonas sp.]|uniref:fructosamine kinase family protein n=2 Tax=Kordiimonas sp. TaxID=1970157 RepID=UPI003A9138CF